MKVNVADSMGPAFDPVFWDAQQHGHTYYWLAGGRGSTKSSFVGMEIPLLMLQHPECHAVVLRKVGGTIKNSVYPQIQWGIEQLQIIDRFKYKMTPPEITLKGTGQKILFLGCDDPMKVKSIKLPFGYVGIVWLEELDQFSGMEEILVDDPDRLVHRSTYLQVPPEWLGEQFLQEAGKLKERNETAYRHEYLGEVTGTGGAVFENVADLPLTDEVLGQFDHRLFGLDFGFAVDPLAFVAMHYDAKHEDLYIWGEIYEQKLTNPQAARKISQVILPGELVRCDSAEPKSIKEMRSLDMNIIGAAKGPDSVEYGIKWLQGLRHIYIDKRRCPNTYREFMTYEYERNRLGQYISAYPDKDNHAIDAVRYGCSGVMPVRTTIRSARFDY